MNIELMNRVRAKVLAEPNRVNMERWQRTKKILGIFKCGTVCCIAGHAIESEGDCIPYHLGQHGVVETGAALLQIPLDEAYLLFFFHNGQAMKLPVFTGAIDPYVDLRMRLAIRRPGTPQYAAVVAEAIDRCIARNHKPDPQPEPEPEPEPIVVETDEVRAHALGVRL
jgi:hypothetical protein